MLRLGGFTSIANEAFQDLTSVQVLEFHRTGIDALPSLTRLTKLTNLTIFFNTRLTFLQETLLTENPNLVHLEITLNPIRILPPQLLANQHNLKFLNLGSNIFKEIPHSILKESCDSLKTLKILHDSCSVARYSKRMTQSIGSTSSGCQRVMPKQLLSSCQNLTSFKYSFTRRSKGDSIQFEKGFLEGAKSLKSLAVYTSIHNNKAVKDLIEPLSKKGYALKKLDLTGNAITNVNPGKIIPFFCFTKMSKSL